MAGYRLGFSPGGFVWHYRRSTAAANLRQQAGYGEAEALLALKHPEFFSALGGSIWRGRIYAASSFGLVTRRSVIYHGCFGSAAFQRLYTAQPVTALMMLTSLPWHLVATLPCFVLSLHLPMLMPLAVATLGISVGVCVAAAAQAEIPSRQKRWWSRALIAALCFLQPIVRGWARFRSPMSDLPAVPGASAPVEAGSLKRLPPGAPIALWSHAPGFERYPFLQQLLETFKARRLEARIATEWSAHDIEAADGPWARLWLSTVTEELPEGRRTLRCRVRTGWTLRAILTMGMVAALIIVATGLLARQTEWIWMTPLLLPLVYFHFENERRRLERLAASAILFTGERTGLTIVGDA